MAVKRKPARRFKRSEQPRVLPLTDTVVVRDTKEGTIILRRNAETGRFTNPSSVQAIDSTVTTYVSALKSLANK